MQPLRSSWYPASQRYPASHQRANCAGCSSFARAQANIVRDLFRISWCLMLTRVPTVFTPYMLTHTPCLHTHICKPCLHTHIHAYTHTCKPCLHTHTCLLTPSCRLNWRADLRRKGTRAPYTHTNSPPTLRGVASGKKSAAGWQEARDARRGARVCERGLYPPRLDGR